MAIEIIPKPIEKIPVWRKILFYFSILLLVGVIISYFVLDSRKKSSEIFLQDLEERISRERTPERIALEKELLDWQIKIKDFSLLLNQHISTSKVFKFFEEKTHPRVFFSQINLNPKDSKVNLSGQTDSFLTLGQQLLIFEKEPLVENLNLAQVSISKEGKVEFGLDFSFDPKILKP